MADTTQNTTDSLPPPPVSRDAKERIFGALGGVLSAGGNTKFEDTALGKHIAEHYQRRVDEAKMHRQNMATYGGVLAAGFNPQTGQPLSDDEKRQYQTWYDAASAAYEKAVGVSKEGKGAAQKTKAILGHIIGQGQSSQKDVSQQSPQQQTGKLTPPPQAGSSTPQTQPYDTKAQVAAPGLAQSLQTQKDFDVWKRQQDILHKFKMEEQEALYKAKAQSGSTPRPVHSGSIGVLDARSLASRGTIFTGEDGEPIDVNALDDSMGLYGMVRKNTDQTSPNFGKWETVYTPFSPSQSTITVGNEVYAVSPMDKSKLSQGAGVDLGQHITPKAGTHEVPMIGPDGKPVAVPMHSTSTPSTPGAKGRGSRPSPPPTATSTPSAPGGGAARPQPSSSGGRPLNALPPGSYNVFQQQARPARLAATQLFGDPDSPNFKPLSDYADLMDDPKSQERIATAWNLIRDHVDQARGDASSGDLTTIMKNYLNVPGAVAESEAAKMRDALNALKPREAEALNREFSTYGTIIGLRALTKGSAAKFSAKNMEQEVPIFGMNVRTKKAFYDKLSTLAEEVNNGLVGIPDVVLKPGERDYYRKQQDALSEKAKSASGSSGSRLSKPPGAGPSTAEELEQEMKKDKKK